MVFIDIDIYMDRIKFNIFKYEYQQKEDILANKIVLPKSYSIGDKLNYIRTMIFSLINQYKIKKAYIQIEESYGIEIIDTVKIEGVVEELFSNCGVEICK